MRQIHQLRDIESWSKSGIQLSTPSNEAAKLFDAAISQFVGWYDEKQFDGFECTMKKMLDADPQFISGRTLVYCLEAIGGSNIASNSILKQNVEQLDLDVDANPNCSKWERCQFNALQFLSTGKVDDALRQWEEILTEFPSDVLSVHLAGLTCLMSGRLERICDVAGRIIPSFQDEYSLGSVHAWHSFGLSEINLHPQAERHAQIALTIDPQNGWATHALAHVFEMRSRYDEGIAYMGKSESSWNFSNHIAPHNYWHWSLYHLTKGDFEAAADILEQKLIPKPGFDSLSLSYLLSMENSTIGSVVDKHSERIGVIVQPYMGNHLRSFIDAHVMMGLCVSKKFDEAEQFMEESIGSEHLQGKEVNEKLLKSILFYSREKFDECVEFLWPIRYNLKQIGGSEAQRDVFSLILINACLRSKKLQNKLLAGQLIEERELRRSMSPMVERLRERL